MDLRFQTEGRWRETPAGIAHYLEHKMFDMASENVMQSFARNGASDNAFTSNAMTAYYFTSTANFYENLRILLRFVSTPYFTQESVDREQGIIAQEIQETEDDPDWRVYANLMERLYQDSPARVPVVGSLESIRQITPQTLYDCHKAFYTPSNMILTVVGGVDPVKVSGLAQRVLPKEGGPVIPRDYGLEPETPAEREIRLAMEVSSPQFLKGYKCRPAEEGEDRLRTMVLGDLACDLLFGESSPLYQRLYSQGIINSSFGGAFELMPGAAFLYAGGERKEPRAAAASLQEEADRLVRQGVDGEFFQRTLRASFGSSLRGLNSFENIAVSLTEGYFGGYDPFRFPEVFDSVTQEDVLAFLRDNVTAERSSLSEIVPKEA